MAARALRASPSPTTPTRTPARPAAKTPPQPSLPRPRTATTASAPPAVRLAAARASTDARGEPLPADVGLELERTFRTSLGDVRVHTGGQAQNVAVTLSARAVTHGSNIFLGPGERRNDLALIGHEVAHVIQQRGGAAPQRWTEAGGDQYEHEAQRAASAAVRGDTFTVRERTGRPRVQRFGISNILDKLAGMANNIPGFRMFTVVLGVNPVNMSAVPRTAANILRAAVEIIPGGGLITQALDSYGIFDKVGTWVEQQISTLGMVGSAIRAALMKFLDSIVLSDLVPWNLGTLADRALEVLSAPARQLKNFVVGLASDILNFIKDALLMPLARLAEGTSGYDLLKAVLGTDPITGDPVPRTADTLIPGFLKLIGEEQTWQNMQRSRAIPRAWAWFQGAMSAVIGFVQEIPGLVVSTIKSLTLSDVFPITGVFVKVGKAFGGFLGRFASWVGGALWNLLEIIFEVVSPGALAYIKKTGAALKSILKNPAPFVGNLIRAAKGGFEAFAGNFGAHLKAGLINWLTGSLPGVYIPKAFSLPEIVKFMLSVLGLTWANIRPKLVKATSETVVKAMETGFELVVTLMTKGPAAFWEQLKGHLANLRDMVVGGITSLILDMIVKKAIPKVVAMFIPGAGFIGLILSIYDTVMTFVNRLKQIAAAVGAFVDSIVAIAAGNIGAAVKKVESVLARLLSLAIAFLFAFAGLGKVADKVMDLIRKIRAPIDKALDALIAWVVSMAKKLFAKVFGKKDAKDERTDAQKNADLKAAMSAANKYLEDEELDPEDVTKKLGAIQKKYKLTTLKQVADETTETAETDHIEGDINPKDKTGKKKKIKRMDLVAVSFTCDTSEYGPGEYQDQLSGQEAGLNKMKVDKWAANRAAYEARKKAGKSGRAPEAAAEQRKFREQEKARLIAEKIAAGIDKTIAEQEVAAFMKTQAALHDPDQIAGGDPKKIRALGSKYINSSIGSQWKNNVGEVQKAVDKVPKKRQSKLHMNVKLKMNKV